MKNDYFKIVPHFLCIVLTLTGVVAAVSGTEGLVSIT